MTNEDEHPHLESPAFGLPDEEIIPTCCWCDGPLRLEGRIAWCLNSEECRNKQISCALSITKDGVSSWMFVPTPRQAEAMMATEPNLFVWGNRGGGKSVTFRMLCHMLACAIPGFKYAILRTSYPELMKNHLAYLKDEMDKLGGEKYGYTYNKTDHITYYPNGSMGFFAQCATDGDVKKILGAEVAMVVFDEAPTFDWGHMRMIAASVRVNTGSGLIPMVRYLGNPIGDSIDELWSYFIDKDVDVLKDTEYRPQNWRAIEMRIQDNPHLNAKEYWAGFSGLAPHIIKAWKEGLRVEENTMFEFYPTKDGKAYHVIDEMPRLSDGTLLIDEVIDDQGHMTYVIPPWVRIYRAYDHGFDPDPAMCLWFAVYGKRILCFRERPWYRTIAEDIGKDIRDDSRGLIVTATYCDPSIDIDTGADTDTIKDKIERSGVPMDCATNNREFYASAIHSILKQEVFPGIPRIQFLKNGCPSLIKYLPRMKFDEKNPAAMAEHRMDHGPVALAYFAGVMIPETSPQNTSRKRPWQIPPKTRSNAGMDRLRHRISHR